MAGEPRVKYIKDPRTIRALAHPLRLRLLGLLRHEGPGTATSLAEAVGEAPSLVSYHLRQLASHGFIEEAPERARDGRERWWRAAHEFTSWSSVDFLDTPERRGADLALRREILRLYVERLEAFLDEEPAWGTDWADAAHSSDYVLRLTPDQLRALSAELHAVVGRYRGLDEDSAEQVQVILHAFPRRGRSR